MTPRERKILSKIVGELETSERCYCDDPPPGENGTVECMPCRDRRLADMLRSLQG